jgi:drug/metabolite transporter (DMT)-like permease
VQGAGAGHARASLLPLGLALLAAALFGAATPASKWLLDALTPLQLAGLLYLGAAAGVAPLALRGGARALAPRGRANARRLAGVVLLGGVLGPVLLLLGLRAASAASASLWLNLELAATALLGALAFGDRLGRRGWLGCAGVLAASGGLALGEGAAGLGAGALVAAACVCWGLDNQWTALLDGMSPAASTLWKGAAAGAVNLGLGLLASPWRAPAEVAAAALAVGALSYGASIALSVHAAHGLGATRAQVAFSSAPFFGVALSALVLGEPLGPAVLAAAALLAASIALVASDRHAHLHVHATLAHTHLHRHDDGHHTHAHEGEPPSRHHSHWHEHEPVAHAHPHWPDLHHRHRH